MSQKVIYPSAARTATPTAVTVNTSRVKALRVVIDITAITATPLLTVTIDVGDSLSGKFVNLLTSAVLAAVGTTALTIALGATVVANVSASAPLGDSVRITVSHGDADSATYSVSAHLIR